MIFTDRTITVRKGESRIDEPIVVYRGDYELGVRFTILNSRFKFMSGTNMIESEKASYGQLAILTPYGGNIFSDIVRCNDGSVTFILTAEMLNQIEEVGLYSFQIRLMDYNKESRVSIPPIEYGIEVREPIASEDHDNSVNNAIVGYSIAKVVDPKEENVGDTFDENGNYNKTKWETGDRISEGKLNKIEDAIEKVNRNEKDNTATLSKRIDNNFNVLDSIKAESSELAQTNAQLSEIANKGTTVEVLERVTKEEIDRQIEDGTIANLTIEDKSIDGMKLKDNAIGSEKINCLTLNKIKDIDGFGVPYSFTKNALIHSIYKHSTQIASDFVANSDGYLTVANYSNKTDNLVNITVGINAEDFVIAKLLPGESLSEGSKTIYYDEFTFKAFNFDGGVILTDNNGEYARVATSTTLSDKYNKTITSINICSESNKYVGKAQTEFKSYEGTMIGVHQNGCLYIKVAKKDVEYSGYVYDETGVKSYIANIQDFKIHLKLKTAVTQPYELTIPVVKLDSIKTYGVEYTYHSNYEIEDKVMVTYVAQATNTNATKSFSDVIVKINATFSEDEASRVVIYDGNNNPIKSQKIKNKGSRYGIEGEGYSFILLDSYEPGETKNYTIKVYNKVMESNNAFNVKYNDSNVTITHENTSYRFDKTKNYLLNLITIDGISVNATTYQSPFRFTHKDSLGNQELFDVANLVSFDVKNGSLMSEVNTKLKYNNILHDITYEIYVNGEIKLINYNKVISDNVDCTGLLVRSNIEFKETPTYLYKNPCSFHSDSQAMCVVYSNGDLPRDGDYGYPTFKSKALGLTNGDTILYSLVCGYEVDLGEQSYLIPKDFLFTNCLVVGLNGSYSTGIYTLNPIIGGVIENNVTRNKYIIKDEIVKHIRNINEDVEKLNTGRQEKLVPSLFARLVLAKEYGMFTLDQISSDFKSLMTHDYRADSNGMINVEDMLEQYEQGKQTLQYNSRVFPLAKYLLKEFKKLNNQSEVKFYEDTIKVYAEMICQVFEKYGNTPLTGSSAVNANSTASGCVALSDGLEIENNPRWLSALNGNHEVLKKFMFLNILQEGNDISTNHFLHYHCYATHAYYSCKIIEDKLIHPSQYAFSCLNAQCEPLEELYCCSRSRRGLGSTIGYIIYLLAVTNTPLSLDICRKTLENLWGQAGLQGGQNYPLYDYEEFPPQVLGTSTPIELQALTDVYYLLEEDNF